MMYRVYIVHTIFVCDVQYQFNCLYRHLTFITTQLSWAAFRGCLVLGLSNPCNNNCL